VSPVRTTSVFDQLPPGVRGLVIANGVVFLILWILPPEAARFVGLLPILVFQKGWVWQLFTYSFVHLNGLHLVFNMWALWVAGPPVESMWGTKTFLKFYALCALGAALTQSVVAPEAAVVGASGAIYGVLLAFGLLFPDAVLLLFFVFPMRAIQAVAVIAVMTLVWAIESGGSRIAHFAHLGGMATAYIYLKLPVWRLKLRSSLRWPSRRPTFKVISPVKGGDEDLSNRVDRILEKISSKGVDSLTPEEHDIMRRYAERKH
jgi:membrane associated rhomboid family serine protease